MEDVDIDSRTDTEECELNETEMSISKFEIEKFEAHVTWKKSLTRIIRYCITFI